MSCICFIGGGNMASAIIGGLYKRVPKGAGQSSIRVAEPLEAARVQLEARFPVETFADGRQAIEGADTIILAVKPQIIPQVLEQIGSKIQPGQLMISIAAGTTCETIENELHRQTAVVRAMPNLPAVVDAGITGLYANPHCRQKDKDRAKEILSAVGQVIWIDKENLMDAVTAVSGTGPAYVFYLIEAMRDAGVSAGLSTETATELALYTVIGSGQLALSDPTDVAELRQRVTSPGGTTAAAVAVLDGAGCDDILKKAVMAARDRGRELSRTAS